MQSHEQVVLAPEKSIMSPRLWPGCFCVSYRKIVRGISAGSTTIITTNDRRHARTRPRTPSDRYPPLAAERSRKNHPAGLLEASRSLPDLIRRMKIDVNNRRSQEMHTFRQPGTRRVEILGNHLSLPHNSTDENTHGCSTPTLPNGGIVSSNAYRSCV